VLLALGAIVTTFQAGMADPIWPTYPWHLLLVPWQNADARFLVEHGHRLAGYVVGCCAIVLVIWLFLSEPRRWVRALGVVALFLIIVQGLIGGFRVKLNDWVGTDLAMTHGTFASVVFSTLVSIALFTSRGWQAPVDVVESTADARRLRRLSLTVVGLILGQIMLGSVLRHQYSTLGQRGHLLMAFAVVFGVAWLVRELTGAAVEERATRVAVIILATLIGVQLLLGVESWMMKYFVPSNVAVQALIRTGHVLVGYLSLAAAVVVCARVFRITADSTENRIGMSWEAAP
jgi:cytochrome c oxidase assembly protein subunit 15